MIDRLGLAGRLAAFALAAALALGVGAGLGALVPAVHGEPSSTTTVPSSTQGGAGGSEMDGMDHSGEGS